MKDERSLFGCFKGGGDAEEIEMRFVGRVMTRLFLVIVIIATATGCTMKIGQMFTHSHFAYPNANVTPLGNVSAETSRTTVFVPKMPDEAMLDEVVWKALKQKGGDLLINYKLTVEVTQIPLLLVSVFVTTLRVTGTAAKQEIGRQELR